MRRELIPGSYIAQASYEQLMDEARNQGHTGILASAVYIDKRFEIEAEVAMNETYLETAQTITERRGQLIGKVYEQLKLDPSTQIDLITRLEGLNNRVNGYLRPKLIRVGKRPVIRSDIEGIYNELSPVMRSGENRHGQYERRVNRLESYIKIYTPTQIAGRR